MQNVPGEAAIPQQVQQQVAPDVTNQQGQTELFTKAVKAHQAKQQFDAVLQAVASHIGADYNSRVKQIETASAKITQKRLEGRDYDTQDINDMLGSRIIVDSENQRGQVKKAIEKLGDAGVFHIDKKEPVTRDTYHAFHYDISLSNGTRAELQIMNKHEEAESLVNHGLRAVHGENPENDAVNQLRDKQASLVNSLPPGGAQALSGVLKQMNKQVNNKPLDPRLTASLLAQMRGGGIS